MCRRSDLRYPGLVPLCWRSKAKIFFSGELACVHLLYQLELCANGEREHGRENEQRAFQGRKRAKSSERVKWHKNGLGVFTGAGRIYRVSIKKFSAKRRK